LQLLQQERLAVLVHGIPGTGKTGWTQAVTHELLGPLRYAVLILDHEAVQEFIAPPYLEGVCLIINEADHLAQDRASEVAQQSMTLVNDILDYTENNVQYVQYSCLVWLGM
jgi:signal transduction histidine kinase